ncbi:MAG: hypothetical protein AAB289_14690, partial [Chloroflexota bacterium]
LGPNAVGAGELAATAIVEGDFGLDLASDVTLTAPAAAHLLVRNAGNTAFANVPLSGDVTLAATGAATVVEANVDHNLLANLATGDVHTQYALLAGRAGGQTLTGGTLASQNLTLDSTVNVTKGYVLLNPSDGNVGIRTTSPLKFLHVGAGADTPSIITEGVTVQNNGPTALTVRDATNNSEMFVHADINGGFLGTATSHDLFFRTANVTKMMIQNSTGNVGIGTTTPTALLHEKGTLSSALTGTVSVTTGTAAVTGVGTAFTTELAVGDSLKIGTEIFTVSTIGSATSLTLDSNHLAGAAGATAYRDPTLLAIDNGDAVNKLTVTRSGNVGVGT